MSAMDTAPRGYRLDRWSRSLGHGDLIFEKAADALRSWEVHKRSGLVVLAEGPPVVGMVVAMCAPLPVGFIDVVCRVVDVVEEGDRFGFAYGTLPVHPERGEESFTVVRAADGSITFEIAAVSRPRQLLARACPPIARKLQRSATMAKGFGFHVDLVTPNEARDLEVTLALSNSFGFGGQNACVAFRALDG
jgi:uncharacterized protein (UPF0548 family)